MVRKSEKLLDEWYNGMVSLCYCADSTPLSWLRVVHGLERALWIVGLGLFVL